MDVLSVPNLLAELEKRGIRLAVEAGSLTVEGPRRAMTPELRQALAERKGEMLAHLAPWPDKPCYVCGEMCWWLHRDGGPPVCGRCHPPAYPEHVKAWIPAAVCKWGGPCH
jgi:hypothetical protein